MTTVSVDYSCSSGSVTATWDVVFGASLYRATAVDGTGASSNCTSASTSCQISMLKCGEKYEVRVTALSGDCSSTSNKSSMFETGEGSGCENKYDLSEAVAFILHVFNHTSTSSFFLTLHSAIYSEQTVPLGQTF